jgi:hypothetical protein
MALGGRLALAAAKPHLKPLASFWTGAACPAVANSAAVRRRVVVNLENMPVPEERKIGRDVIRVETRTCLYMLPQEAKNRTVMPELTDGIPRQYVCQKQFNRMKQE